jgi:hypothetical protein
LLSQSRTAFSEPPMGVAPVPRSSLLLPAGKSSLPSIQVSSSGRLVAPAPGKETSTSADMPKPPERGSLGPQQVLPLYQTSTGSLAGSAQRMHPLPVAVPPVHSL